MPLGITERNPRMHGSSTPKRARGRLVALIFAVATAFSIMACGSSGSSGAPGATFDNGGGGGGTLETEALAEPTVAE